MKKLKLLLTIVLACVLAFSVTACAEKTFTISFDTLGGSAVEAITVQADTAATAPTAPTKVGFAFTGWYTEEALSTLYKWEAPVTGNLKLFAKWTADVKITFNSNFGSAVDPISLEAGKVATAPTAPTRAGYTFEGWFTDALLENAFVWTKAVTANVTLTAKWTAITYEVTFDSQGGNSVQLQTIAYDAVAVLPETAPTRDGYAFGGWYKEVACTTAYVWTDKVTASFTLFAKWTNAKYPIAFVTDGGTINAGNVAEYTFGDVVVLPTDVTKQGFIFSGWFATSEFGGEKVLEVKATDFGDKTYYAYFEEDLGTLSSYVERFENSTLLPTGAYGSYSNRPNVKLGQYNWSISAYTALGDARDRKEGNVSARLRGNSSDAKNTNRVELNTYVTGLLQVTCLYGSYSSHGDGVIEAYYQVEGTTEWIKFGTKTAPKWADVNSLSLAKFNIPKAARTQSIRFKIEKVTDTVNKYGSVCIDNLTMNFSADTTSVVSFESNGGSYVDPILLAKNTAAAKPKAPIRDLNKFMGWFTDVELTATYDFATLVATDVTLYAKWEALVLNGLTLTTTGVKTKFYLEQPFNAEKLLVTANYSEGVNKVLDVVDYTLTILNSDNVVVTEADFLAAPAGAYTVKIAFNGKEATYPITKHAIAAPIHDVTFDLNYTGSTNPVVQVPEEKFATIATPTRAGYVFLGWFAENTCVTPVDLTTTQIIAAVTYYAKWDTKHTLDFENPTWKDVAYAGTDVKDLFNYHAVGYGKVSTSDNYDKYSGKGGLRLKGLDPKKPDQKCNLELMENVTGLKSIKFNYAACGVFTSIDNNLSKAGAKLVLYYMVDGTTDWVEAKTVEVGAVRVVEYPAGSFDYVVEKFEFVIPATVTQPIRFKIGNMGTEAVTIDNVIMNFAA